MLVPTALIARLATQVTLWIPKLTLASEMNVPVTAVLAKSESAATSTVKKNALSATKVTTTNLKPQPARSTNADVHPEKPLPVNSVQLTEKPVVSVATPGTTFTRLKANSRLLLATVDRLPLSLQVWVL